MTVNSHTDRSFSQVPRTRGAVSGVILILLGAWGALVPFIGPYFDYSYGNDDTWRWTSARGWLEVLPGAAVAAGALLLLLSANRFVASFGGWLAVAGGAWFVLGRSVAGLLHIGSVGTPTATGDSGRAAAELGYFTALGPAIVLIAAFALGRLAVVGVRDVRAAERRAVRSREAEEREVAATAAAQPPQTMADSARPEPARPEPARPEPARPEPARPEMNRTAEHASPANYPAPAAADDATTSPPQQDRPTE